MNIHEQLACLKIRTSNLAEHCAFHRTDKDAKRILKVLKGRAKVLRAILKKQEKGSEETVCANPIKAVEECDRVAAPASGYHK